VERAVHAALEWGESVVSRVGVKVAKRIGPTAIDSAMGGEFALADYGVGRMLVCFEFAVKFISSWHILCLLRPEKEHNEQNRDNYYHDCPRVLVWFSHRENIRKWPIRVT